MSKKQLERWNGSVMNFMPRDVIIVNSAGGRRHTFARAPIAEASVMLCNKECPNRAANCPLARDVTSPLCIGVMEKDAQMSVKRIATLNDGVPIYRWNSKKPEVVRELKKCLASGMTSMSNLPDVKQLRRNLTRVGSQMVARSIEMTLGLKRDLEVITAPIYTIVSYSIALMMAQAGDEMDWVLVPILPVYGTGKLLGYRGLMPAKFLVEG